MEIFYAVCAGIITVAAVIVTIYLVATLAQVKETARAVEYFVLNANDRVESMRGMFDMINAVSNSVRSGWMRAFQVAFELFSGRKKRED